MPPADSVDPRAGVDARDDQRNALVGWWVVVPVKGGLGAKSRLGFLAPAAREALAGAMARDTVVAALSATGVAAVVVVTADPEVGAWARGLGASAAADPGRGLDAAVTTAVAGVPDGRAVAVLLGDHPALAADELDAALAGCAAHDRALVEDASGTGTALLTAVPAGRLVPAFGPGSAARHRDLGHVPVGGELAGLRTDVDELTSLAAAARIGLGPATQAALDVTLAAVQATIHTSHDDGSGSVLLDDGLEVGFAAPALVGSGLRHLRPGQRVTVELDATGPSVTRIRIVGIGEGERIR